MNEGFALTPETGLDDARVHSTDGVRAGGEQPGTDQGAGSIRRPDTVQARIRTQ